MKELSTDARFLDPRTIRIEEDPFGGLVLVDGTGDRIGGLRPVRAFPLTAPDRHISLLDAEGHEVGVIRDAGELDPKSLEALEGELEMVYFMPRVLRIRSVLSSHGMTTWELETDRGPRTVYVRDRNDIRRLRGGRVVMTDVNGVKYDIPNWRELDKRSSEMLEQEM